MWTDPLDAAGLAVADGVRRIVATISISGRDSTCRLDAEYPTTGHGIIDGRRDLAGFFPVYLDIKQLRTLFPPGAQFAYKLKHANQGVNVVFTPFPRPDATGYQTDYNKAGQILSGLTFRVDAAGLSGPSASLNSIATEDKGVFLLEGWAHWAFRARRRAGGGTLPARWRSPNSRSVAPADAGSPRASGFGADRKQKLYLTKRSHPLV